MMTPEAKALYERFPFNHNNYLKLLEMASSYEEVIPEPLPPVTKPDPEPEKPIDEVIGAPVEGIKV
jgi:hypothetical protein